MSNEKMTKQRIRMVALAHMEPESGYQRDTNPAQVESIVNSFDESKLGTLTVSERDGKYHIIDGAHRSKALRALGYTHASCVVLTGLTFEQEAEYFRNQNQDKRGITPMEFFKAGLVSGNELCVRMFRIANMNGFYIGTSKKDFSTIEAVKALFIIVDDYGYEILDDTLSVIGCTWSGILRASQAESLLGVAEFISRYGTVDFDLRMIGKFPAVYADYTEAARTRSYSKAARVKFCRALVEHYNRGLTYKSKKRLVWEG